MTTNRVRNNLGKGKGEALSLQKYISVLLAAFVFVLGMLGGGTADAAKVASEEISRTATIELRAKKGEDKPTKTVPIKMTVKLENIDITAYAKYTAEIQKNDKYKRIVFAKAAPGSKVTITVDPAPIPGMLSKPARNMNYSESVNYYNHKKIGTLKELTSLGKESSFYNNYTIPNDVEEVTATVDLTYHVGMEVGKDMKSSTGTYRKEPALARHYYIFTSDTACKKAFELMTASSVTGAISNVLGGDKKPNAKSDSKDSGGMEMVIGVVIGVAVLGAVGYGAYRMFGKGGGSKGLSAWSSALLCWAPSATARTGCLAKAEAAKGTAQVIIITLLAVRSQCNGPVRRCLIHMVRSQCNDPVRQCLIRMDSNRCNDPVRRHLIRMDSSQCNDPEHRCLIRMDSSQCNDLVRRCLIHMVRSKLNGLAQP